MRLAGHTLKAEGAAYQDGGAGPYPQVRVTWNTTSGVGFGLCSCGERSPILDSANMRKAWHRTHKALIAARRTAQATGMSD